MGDTQRPDFLSLSRDILSEGTNILIPKTGSSMYPVFKNGDSILVEPLSKNNNMAAGDILVFQKAPNTRMVAHRLIRICRDNGKTILFTKGDTLPGFDKPIYPEDVLGKVVAVKRGERWLKVNNGLYGAINIFLARTLPFNRWAYPLLRKIKHGLERIRGRYASRRFIDTLMRKGKY